MRKGFHPIYTLLLALCWCAFNLELSLLNFVFGYIVALVILWWAKDLWPYRVRFHKPLVGLRLVFNFVYDLIVSNFQVLAIVLKPRIQIEPAFVRFPLDLKNDLSINILAFMITLTPGTLTVDRCDEGSYLLIHCINTQNPEEVVSTIKKRFEKPLLEVLECSNW